MQRFDTLQYQKTSNFINIAPNHKLQCFKYDDNSQTHRLGVATAVSKMLVNNFTVNVSIYLSQLNPKIIAIFHRFLIYSVS